MSIGNANKSRSSNKIICLKNKNLAAFSLSLLDEEAKNAKLRFD